MALLPSSTTKYISCNFLVRPGDFLFNVLVYRKQLLKTTAAWVVFVIKLWTQT